MHLWRPVQHQTRHGASQKRLTCWRRRFPGFAVGPDSAQGAEFCPSCRIAHAVRNIAPGGTLDVLAAQTPLEAHAVEDGSMWFVEKIEISGGFLPGFSVNIPRGLTCIIGARGSGKSTLAEAVRFAICGLSSAPKPSVDLIQANLAGGALVTITALVEGSNRYTIKRGLKQTTRSSHCGRQGDQECRSRPRYVSAARRL